MARLAAPAVSAILEAIAGISAATADKGLDDYAASWVLRHAIQRGVEIISEASRRLPPELQATQPQVPWPLIMGVGNVLRHEYHRISDVIIWRIVVDDLPILKAAALAMEAALRDENNAG